jgi:fatty acyl-CoA reductase
MLQVLVEKLLRSTQVRKVFLLIRAKKGVSPEQRLQELLSTPIFDTLKASCPELAGRVQVLSGDITLPCFGLCAADEKTLIDEVGVIFHSAATIRFNEKLTEAVNLNVVAVQTLMQIAKKMKKLEALVQVSTAYCNTELSKVPEEVQDHGEPARLVSMVQAMEPDLANSLTPHIIGKNPNTSTVTKALGECVLQQEGDCLPIAIVRPSMVVAAWREPIPGWVDNLNGPTGMMAATGKGVLRSVWAMGDMVADFVPVDICIKQAHPGVSLHQLWYPLHHLAWAKLQPLGLKSFKRFPFEAIYRYPYATQRENYWANRAAQAVLHNLPAHIMDMVARATRGMVVVIMDYHHHEI